VSVFTIRLPRKRILTMAVEAGPMMKRAIAVTEKAVETQL
jgi:hypothetical protein